MKLTHLFYLVAFATLSTFGLAAPIEENGQYQSELPYTRT